MITPSSRLLVKWCRSSSLSFPRWRTFSTSSYLYVCGFSNITVISRKMQCFPSGMKMLPLCGGNRFFALHLQCGRAHACFIMLLVLYDPTLSPAGHYVMLFCMCSSANRIQGSRRPSCLTSSVRFTSPPTAHRWTCSPTSSAVT